MRSLDPHDLPGTYLVCVNDDPDAFRIPTMRYRPMDLDGLCAGDSYILAGIEPEGTTKSGYAAFVKEIDRPPHGDGRPCGFDIGRFAIKPLPRELTECLGAKPIRKLAKV